jgi:hypothetical protein
MTGGIDWVTRAGAKPKGRRPEFFEDPATERLMSLAMALAGEVSVLRERLDTLERLLESTGTVKREDIETYTPDRDAAQERGEATRAFIARVMRGFQQEVEAMQHPDPPVEDWVKELRKP